MTELARDRTELATTSLHIRRLARDRGVPVRTIATASSRVSCVAMAAVWERVSVDLGDRLLPAAVADIPLSDTLSPVTILGLSQPTLRAALRAVLPRWRVVSEAYELVCFERHNRVELVFSDHAHSLGALLGIEYHLADIVHMARTANPAFRPVRVELGHRVRGGSSGYEEFFGCEVAMGRGRTAIVADADALEVPLSHRMPAAVGALSAAAVDSALERLDAATGVADLVRTALATSTAESPPGLETLAKQHGFSARTLNRRLADEGTTFRAIRDDARRQRAETLLATTASSVEEIAFRLGFSSARAFQRAFRRWSGTSPGAFRRGQ